MINCVLNCVIMEQQVKGKRGAVGMIHIKEVVKTFINNKQELRAVDHVSLDIEQGEIFGIIGYSGAGKSTLIRLLNLLEKPTQGSITIHGSNLNELTSKELRRKRQEIGMIFQHFNLLWSRTVSENIAFPLEIAGVPRAARDERVQELINMVGLEGKEQYYPAQLSGGQKQRVGIARALANQPKVLLCDEATSALDPKTTDSILQLLKKINHELGLTIVLITHEMHVIQKICDRVAVMENGRVVELGSVVNIFQDPQQKMTQEFVREAIDDNEEHYDYLKSKITEGMLIKCQFKGTSVEQGILSKLIRQFDIEVSILHGKINPVKNSSTGTLVFHALGYKGDLLAAVDFLKQHGLEVEVIKQC